MDLYWEKQLALMYNHKNTVQWNYSILWKYIFHHLFKL